VPVVLIVDDSDANRKLARVVLRADGLETVEAATGAEGIALAIEHVPDVILMDLRLPDMDGAQAARRLSENDRTSRIPVVAMSVMPLEESGEWLEAAGFAGWLAKPIRVGTFPDQVRFYCPGG
jgi:two-component system, cell cycle response regulator DivK